MGEFKYCNVCKDETPHLYDFEVQAWRCYLCGNIGGKKKI